MATLGTDEITRELRDALTARAQRLDLAVDSIHPPSPGAMVARTTNDDLLRLDIAVYASEELSR
jgi:hypothetical protein